LLAYGRSSINADLNNRHRDTVEKIFRHPASGNVGWRQVLSLIEAIGTAEQQHNGKIRVTIGPETEVMTPSAGKDVDKQSLVDLRRMLEGAGFNPGDSSTRPDNRVRDHGDGRWGEPGQ
jgi:hypothetical protein